MDETERTCRYGHGPLVRRDGAWSLDGRQIRAVNESEKSVFANEEVVADETGQIYAVFLWRCPVCGYLEMSDTDTESD